MEDEKDDKQDVYIEGYTGKKYILEEPTDCDCPCHEQGVAMLHIIPCCENGKIRRVRYIE